jgi:hypothetical protein
MRDLDEIDRMFKRALKLGLYNYAAMLKEEHRVTQSLQEDPDGS